MKHRIWITLTVLLLVAVACDIVPTSQANDGLAEEVRSETGGYSFTKPSDYEVLSLMSDFSIIDLELIGKDWETSEVGEGPHIQLNGFANSNNWTLEKFAEHGNNVVKVHYTATSSATQEAYVAGLKGIAYDYEYELPDAGLIRYRDIYVMVNQDQLFNINCFSPVAAWDKTLADFNAIINSITFFEPVPSPTNIP